MLHFGLVQFILKIYTEANFLHDIQYMTYDSLTGNRH